MSAIPIGTVIERPTGELAALWQMFALSLERNAQLRRENAALRRARRPNKSKR